LTINSNSNGIDYLKKGIGIDKFGIEVCYKILNPQINLSFNFLIHRYFLHDNPTWNISRYTDYRYSEYLYSW